MTKNHFATLGLKADASEDDIKKAYRNLAKKWHPDKNKESGAEDKFKEISAAYEYLKSEDRREILARDLNKPKENTRTQSKFESNSHKNGYSYSYSNTTEEEPGSSYWSKKFGKTSDERYKNSTFGHFADEGREHYSKPKMGQKSNRKQTKPPPRKPWSQDWNNMGDSDEELYDNVPFYSATSQSRPNFSFAFKSFVDDLGVNFDAFFSGSNIGMFEFTSFFNGNDPFTDFFSQGSASPFGMDGVYRRPRKRNVADERGANGLDPDYFFTPQFNAPSRTQSAHSMRAETTSPNDDMDSRWFKCTYCEKRMPFSQLSSHEPGCALRKGGKFDHSDTEDEFGYAPDEDQYPQNTGDWRQTHEELLRSIRRAKKAAKQNGYRSGSATTRTTESEEPTQMKHPQINCQWCGRNFSHPAARQHIPFCEKWTKEHGTPLNPAGKRASRDVGSKSQRAKEYAKHIPRPRDKSKDSESPNSPRTHFDHFPDINAMKYAKHIPRPRDKSKDSESPNSPRTHFDHFPDINATKRETMNKPGPSSGTGLHASDSFSPRGFSAPEYDYYRFPPDDYYYSSKSYTAKPKVNVNTRSHSSKFTSPNTENPFTSPMDDSYSFNISGTKLKTDNNPSKHTETCRVCKKRIRGHARLTCNCGIRKTGA